METPAKISLDIPEEPAAGSTASMVSRITKGFGALSLSVGIQIIAQIAVVPVALYAWGKVRYGEWILLTGLVTFLRLTDLGLQTLVVNRLSASYARGEREEMQRSLSTALRIQIPLALGVLAITAVLLATLPIERILAVQTIGSFSLLAVAALLTTELLLNVPMGIISGVYRATGRLPRAAVIGACQQFVVTLLTITLIALNSTFVSLAALRVAVVVISSLWIVYDLRRLYPWLHLWPKVGSWSDGARMIRPGIFFILIPLADYLSIQFTLLVLQHSLDGGEVSRLTTHRTVVNVAMMASGLLTNAVWPEITWLHARSASDQLRKTHRSFARINMWFVGAIAFGMLPFIPIIYPSWTSGKLSIDAWTLAFLMTRMLLWGIWSASMATLCAIGRQQSVALVLLGAAALTSMLSVWLIPRIGMSGAALAQLIGDVSISAWIIPFLASRETKDNYVEFMGETAMALIKGLLIPIGLGLLGWRLISSEVVRLVVLVPAISCLAVALMWSQLADYERSHFSGLVKAKLG